MSQKIYSILLAILGLSIIIIVHESGHFLMCKLFDVRTPVFSVGFGPVLASYTIKETAFQLAALPLGGYVAIDPASLATKTYLQKLIINIAGIVFNIIFALLLLIYLSWLANRKKTLPIVTEVMPNSPASGHIFPGDRIIAINATPVHDDGMLLINSLVQLPGKEINLTVERDGKEYTIPITVGKDHPQLGKHIGWLGASFKTVNSSSSLILALYNGILTTYQMIVKMASAMFGMWRPEQRAQVMGPVGIITSTTEQPSVNPHIFMIWWLVIISINVAVFNLLPIPLLDGGHIMLDTIEALYGKPLPSEVIGYINLIFLLLFLAFFFLITMRDVQRLKKRKE